MKRLLWVFAAGMLLLAACAPATPSGQSNTATPGLPTTGGGVSGATQAAPAATSAVTGTVTTTVQSLPLVVSGTETMTGTATVNGNEASGTITSTLPVSPSVEGTAVPGTGNAAGKINTYLDFISGLEANNATVSEQGGLVNQPGIPVSGRLITVNGAVVQVFEFKDTASRQSISDLIRLNQSSIAQFAPVQAGEVTVWTAGKIIVVYVGADQGIISLIGLELGSPLAQVNASGQVPGQIIAQAQLMLAEQLGVNLDQVTVLSYEQVQWPDTCLGLGAAGQTCAQATTPGWRITFSVNGTPFEFRADANGTILRQAGK